MATKTLARGMGTFFKDCDHPRSRWSKCPHLYKIRFRNAAGKQTEESGFALQDDAIDRLTAIYNAKKSTPAAKAQRIERFGSMQFREYAEVSLARRRRSMPESIDNARKVLENHAFPEIGSRRIASFDNHVVERFIESLERDGKTPAVQITVFNQVKSVLKDAHRRGIISDDPFLEVVSPQYEAPQVVIPTPGQLALIKAFHAKDPAVEIVAEVMSGIGARNGEALAVNLNNIVANDVYRIREQVNTSGKLAKLKHRKLGEFRETPLPRHTRIRIERFAEKHGVTDDGYLLYGSDMFLSHNTLGRRWDATRRGLKLDPEMTLYGLRHFFASNCLRHGVPITDVAEWMGHKNIELTYRIYRHLMPGSIGRAAKILDGDLQWTPVKTA